MQTITCTFTFTRVVLTPLHIVSPSTPPHMDQSPFFSPTHICTLLLIIMCPFILHDCSYIHTALVSGLSTSWLPCLLIIVITVYGVSFTNDVVHFSTLTRCPLKMSHLISSLWFCTTAFLLTLVCAHSYQFWSTAFLLPLSTPMCHLHLQLLYCHVLCLRCSQFFCTFTTMPTHTLALTYFVKFVQSQRVSLLISSTCKAVGTYPSCQVI